MLILDEYGDPQWHKATVVYDGEKCFLSTLKDENPIGLFARDIWDDDEEKWVDNAYYEIKCPREKSLRMWSFLFPED